MSAVPPLRHKLKRAAGSLPKARRIAKKFLAVDSTLRIENHQKDKREQKDHGKYDGNTIEVTLDNTRASVR